MEEYTKENLTELLNENIVRVDFVTTKGVECTKYATLKDSILPPKPVVEEGADENDSMKKTRKVNPDVLNFWSVEDNNWRATRIENIKAITPLGEDAAEQLVLEEAQKRADAALLIAQGTNG